MNEQRKWFKLTLLLSLVFVFMVAGCGSNGDGADVNKGADGMPNEGTGEKGTITFGVTPWTSTIPPTHVAKLLLEDMGYKVELQEGDAGIVFTALSRGDIDVFMDAWLPDMHRNYMERYADTLVDTAISYPDGELGWVIPDYVDINSFEELKGNEDLFGGKVYGIEEGAGMTITSRDMIEAYGLDLEYVPSSETGMLTQAKRMIDREEPVIFLGWRPHPMFVNWDLKVLEDPDKFFERSEVHVITNGDFQEKSPEAFELLSNWSIDVGEIEKMIIEIENGKQPEEVAREWIDQNQEHIQKIKNE